LLRLPAADRAVLVRSILTLAAARVAIGMLPFRTVRRLLSPRRRGVASDVITAERVKWAIGHAQRIIPDATCLPQAVAAEAMLIRGGHPVTLRIGVMKTPAGKLEAHAWAESAGRIIVGDLPWGLGDYTKLPPLPSVWPDSRTEESP
jgi:hypothetical protein